ncbi:MAG: hypothetical protein CM15mP79_1470 [Methanobacteriota archaeon]|nr:MAG: hypothetical protein CM15mP79_1470 [Euryarchaeota archaeon]
MSTRSTATRREGQRESRGDASAFVAEQQERRTPEQHHAEPSAAGGRARGRAPDAGEHVLGTGRAPSRFLTPGAKRERGRGGGTRRPTIGPNAVHFVDPNPRRGFPGGGDPHPGGACSPVTERPSEPAERWWLQRRWTRRIREGGSRLGSSNTTTALPPRFRPASSQTSSPSDWVLDPPTTHQRRHQATQGISRKGVATQGGKKGPAVEGR